MNITAQDLQQLDARAKCVPLGPNFLAISAVSNAEVTSAKSYIICLYVYTCHNVYTCLVLLLVVLLVVVIIIIIILLLLVLLLL